MIKTFIFDLGRVIVPFDHEIGLEILERHCTFLRDDIRAKIFASNELQLFQTGKISSDEFFAAMKLALNIEIGFDEFVEIWNSSLFTNSIIEETLIERLSQKYRLLVLSDTNTIHFEFIRQNYPILRHFHDFILSHEVGFLKPAKEIFQVAVKRANCLPEECIFTDDLAPNVEAARKIGIQAIQFVSPEQFLKDVEKIMAGSSKPFSSFSFPPSNNCGF